MSVELLDIQVLYERWGEPLCPFDHLSLTISAGEWVMLAGPNGSGKSTLLRAIAGLQDLHRGEIVLWGDSRSSTRNYRDSSAVFLVHQNPLHGTASELSVFENMYLAEGCPRNRIEARKRYRKILETVGLGEHLSHPVTGLSGGQRQLLAIAIAALRPAKLILLDEPFASLDPTRSTAALESIRALHDEGRTILQVSHDPEMMTIEGTRTVVLDRGRFVYDGRGKERESQKRYEAIVSVLTRLR